MRHTLNSHEFLVALTEIKNPSISEKRNWKTEYRGHTCGYWNFILWSSILNIDGISGDSIDRYEFRKLDEFNCVVTNIKDRVFNLMNSSSRCLQFDELETFLNIIDQNDYDEIMNCLSIEVKVLRDSESIHPQSHSEDLSVFLTPLEETERLEELTPDSSLCPFLKWIFPGNAMRTIFTVNSTTQKN